MARPQEFDEKLALSKARDLFWKKGFHATSVGELVSHTGVCKASLYKTFGNKTNLFEKSLQQYRQEQLVLFRELVDAPGKVKDKLRMMCEARLEAVREGNRKGCLILNTAAELANEDPEILKMLQANEAQHHSLFQAMVEKGQASGEIDAKQDPSLLAQYLLTLIQGLTMRSLTAGQEEDLRVTIDYALDKI